MANKKDAGEIPEVEKKDVQPLTPEQMEMVNSMIDRAVRSSSQTGAAVSVYGLRDPNSIESVNVKRIFGKFVIGFKNLQDDPLKKVPKYLTYKFDPIRKIADQPYITLLLSDGKDEEEREILLSDYYNNRDYYKADIVEIIKETKIEQHGVLGTRGSYAGAVDDKNQLMSVPAIKAETKRDIKVFVVKLPGFEKPVHFISDFLA